MKRWLSPLRVGLALGLVAVGVLVWRSGGGGAGGNERAQWRRQAERWRHRAGDALEQRVTPLTMSVLTDLMADGQRLMHEQPAGANPSELRFMLSRVEGLAEKVQRVDWEEVVNWEHEVQAATDALRKALADPKNWDEERAAALRAAEAHWGELRASRPWCADPAPEEELLKTMAQVRSAQPPGRR